jgi:preprotein translocase subunit SecA
MLSPEALDLAYTSASTTGRSLSPFVSCERSSDSFWGESVADARPGLVSGRYPERTDTATRRSVWGNASARNAAAFVRDVIDKGSKLSSLGRSGLDALTLEVRERLAVGRRSSETLAEIFALVRENARRELGMAHYEVQLLGGYWMAHGRIAELATGEGKSLAVTLPACASALGDVPVHIVSANDYLVERDAEALRPLYESLGLSVSSVLESTTEVDRRRAGYSSHVTFATTRSLAFDYLRDTLGRRSHPGYVPLLRGLCHAVVDEADSVLIDQAGMPLVLAAPTDGGEERRVQRTALRLASRLEHGRDFRVDPAGRQVSLLERGRAELETLVKPLGGAWAGPRRRELWVEQALQALWAYRRDRDYVVREGVVELVDPATGRPAPDRSWERGLQQLVELKEGCTPTSGRETLARISVQRFYRRYLQLTGTTGTAREAAREMRTSYGLTTVSVPTRLPGRRIDLGTRVYAEARAKWASVVGRIRELREQGRPVLIGTGTVAGAQHLGTLLRGCEIPHRILSARQDAHEAEIIAGAGAPGCVTVATQMAGRGTDIELESQSAEAGGLHVIATEWGDPTRVERQLIGRCARQGDPGSFECVYSLDDEAALMRLPGWLRRAARRSGRGRRGEPIQSCLMNLLTRWLRSTEEAQRRARRRQLVSLEDELEQMLAFSGRGE